MRLRSILIILFCCPAALAAAQSPLRFTPVFRNYTTTEGLPSNEVFAIEQDRQGYMWFGTNNGVCRYNGYTFERFPDTLRSNFTSVLGSAMMEDACGHMWWADFQGRVFYHENGHIIPWAHNDTLTKLRSQFQFISYMVVGGCGEELWLDLRSFGIFHARQDGNWEILPRPEGATDHYWEREGRSIHTNFLSRAARPTARIFFDSYGKQSFEKFPSTIYRSSFFSVVKLRSEYILASISHVNPNTFLFRHGELLWQRPYDLDISAAYHDDDGSLLVAHSGGGGLRHYRSLDDFRDGRIAGSYLKGLSISKIFKDREGGYWFSTQERGVFYCMGLESGVVGGLAGMAEGVCTGVAATPEGLIFQGTRNGRVFELDPVARICRDISPGSMSYLNTLYYDSSMDMLIAPGIWTSFYKKRQWQQSSTLNQGKFFSTRFCTTDTSDLWWATGPNQLFLVDLSTRRELFHNQSQRFFSVCVSPGGRVWTSNFDGIWEYCNEQLQRPDPMYPAFEWPAYDMLLLPDSSMAMAVKGFGVAFWKPGSGASPQFIGSAQGLVSDKISRLYLESDGALWACSEQGASRISPGRSKVDNFTLKTGLPSNEVHQVAVAGGYYWFATGAGLFRMRERPAPAPMPAPLLEHIQVEGMPYTFENDIRLPYDSTNISVEWVALHFRSSGQIPYRYRLLSGERISERPDTESANTSWIYTSDRRSNFSNLAPGAYRFEVQAQDEDGLWSEATAWEFNILPPWWQTPLFQGAVLLVLAGLGFGLYKYRTGQLKRDFAIKQQMFELERSALQAQMNPHFIFNCLNSIQGFITANDKDRAAAFLAQFARLIRQTLEHSFQKEITLEEEVAYLKNYLSLEHLRFRDAFQYKIQVDESLDAYEIVLPSMLVQPFVENAILHGMKGKTAGGRVWVHFEPFQTGLRVTIEDNGPGIAGNGDENPQGGKAKSYGTQLAHRRLALAAQYPNASIRSSIGAEGGTLVEITLV